MKNYQSPKSLGLKDVNQFSDSYAEVAESFASGFARGVKGLSNDLYDVRVEKLQPIESCK